MRSSNTLYPNYNPRGVVVSCAIVGKPGYNITMNGGRGVLKVAGLTSSMKSQTVAAAFAELGGD